MITQTGFAFQQSGADADLLTRLLEKADLVLIKKLSNNDRQWAHEKIDDDGRVIPGKRKNNQAGVYIPHEQRDSGFFPPLQVKDRAGADGDEIREVFFRTVWPQSGVEEREDTRLVHYTRKGQETHLTRVPKPAFADLLPASFLVMGRMNDRKETFFECLTIDSDSDEATLLADILNLQPDFLIDIFEPNERKKAELERILDFAEQVIAAWLAGNITSFAHDNASMPPTIDLARMARNSFLSKYRLETINPFKLEAPGDVLREISRMIEWDLFREYQRRERSVELVRLVLGDEPKEVGASAIIRKLIDELPSIDALMLSASQQRKSRAGYSYEHHIEAMLGDGNIPFEKQVILASKKRPDFILPSLAFIDSGKAGSETGLILSAKTTLRERWKQVEREKGSRPLFLTTVDENIAGSVIEDMASIGVSLVIPESLRKAKETEYDGHSNVLSFRDFCENAVRPHLTNWTA
ncbi:type II restriction endonuclease [Mesorhizobium loti]|uniref:Restriction endonuclease n=1 Tax=Mesorhizobium loti R88b TaxID=935548 RepID=A0A6M7WDI5_RHILI|nr:type II restriction endonuclease [Mesorhizobium loti]QKD00552.1 restriction endonuclease [Mesorhizobium loti R88b]